MSEQSFLASVDQFSLYVVTSTKDLTPQQPLKLVWILPSGKPFDAMTHDVNNMQSCLSTGKIAPTADEVQIPETDMRGRQIVRAVSPASTPS